MSLRTTRAATHTSPASSELSLDGRVDGEFVRLLEDKGVEVHAPTEAEMKVWCQATRDAELRETLQFRRDWDAGKYARQEMAYAERFASIEVPVEAVLRNFR